MLVLEQQLLGVARKSVSNAARGTDEDYAFETTAAGWDGFVTIRRDGQVRGCCGVERRPLTALVIAAARRAAVGDPRFDPIKYEDVQKLQIEVNLVFPRFEISAERIVPGVHGVILEFEGRRGLLLPHVAIERRLGRESLLRAVCQKAGLPGDVWRDARARIQAFVAYRMLETNASLLRESNDGH